MPIDWNNLIPLNGSKNAAFENLCCQLAKGEDIPNRDVFTVVGAPDAGIECYWKLLDGKEVGWQAKYFLSSPGSSQWSQIDESVKTALHKYPDLSRYIVCLPINRADARIENQKSFMDKWNERVKKWEDWADAKGMSVTFDYWGESEILERLSRSEFKDKYNFLFGREESQILTGKGEVNREHVIKYLENIIEKANELPVYVAQAKSNQGRENLFMHIRQKVEVYDSQKLEELKEQLEENRRKQNFDLAKLKKAIERIEWKEVNTKDFHRLIILGKPGIGKSWLLRYEANQLAEKIIKDLKNPETSLEDIVLPIWVNLADWANRSRESEFPISSLADLVIETFTDVLPYNRDEFNVFQVWISRKISSENCLILLDALDEIPRDMDFTRKLRNFSNQEAKSAKIYITCREAEYRGSPIVSRQSKIKEIGLLEFEDEQIRQFYEAWFGKDSEKAYRFKDILDNNSSLRDLARTPLLLSLLCALLDETENISQFPKSRREVCEQCIDKIFFREWKDDRIFSGVAPKRELPKKSEVKKMLSWIGFHLFKEIGEQFTEIQLFEKIKIWWLRHYKSIDSPARIDNVIQQLRDDGLITTVSKNPDSEKNVYMFLHRTFLEFFAACGLADLKKDDDGESWEEIVFKPEVLFDPHWTEVLQLLGGALSPEDAIKYINKLLRINGKNGEGDILFRPLKLAVNACLESEEQVKSLMAAKTADEVIEKYLYAPRRLTDKWFISWVKGLGVYAIDKLLLRLNKADNYKIRRSIVWALGEIKIKSREVTQVLNAIVINPNENELVRRSAAESLIYMKSVSETPVEFLEDFFIDNRRRFINNLKTKNKELLRIRSLEILMKLDNPSPEVVNYATEVLKDRRQDNKAKRRIAAALMDLKNPPEDAKRIFNSNLDWQFDKIEREHRNRGKNIFDREYLSEEEINSLIDKLKSEINSGNFHSCRYIIEALSKQNLTEARAEQLLEITLNLPIFNAGFHRDVINESLFRISSIIKKSIPANISKNR